MRISKTTYEKMKKAIQKMDVQNMRNHRENLKTLGNVKCVEERLRWDVFHHSGLGNLYAEDDSLKDEHIDTALRKIFKELDI